ncbi:MAG: 2OG-Fe(II) oxygenase [Okeania sp. SIO3H1]|uniref:2OG-Fe(II) oxygenase n=1 Tax=Okeania sp. SIO1I7 TaxID=2607772 RepID=UPI0013C79ECE|nr:2OG-Fe(II) oxygenase [Okeania sp. SIO1I7]NEN88887.1 2OG-Fe(II) oxygenase [Okeania sp. SIO3H1]NET29288.1 2OG-Fe(II) oxygenase [Okeania sp. SIO1I7]
MVWISPEQKYRQITYACYDASQKEHFCQPGENWGALTEKECDWVISLSKQIKPSNPTVDGKLKPEVRQVKAWGVNYSASTRWLWERLTNSVKYANNKWWNYDIYGIIDSLQLLCYEASNNQENIQDHYNKHLDNGDIYYYRKISISIQLSNPQDYEGSQLKLYTNRDPEKLPKERGTMVLFPSIILHEVTPITQGKRWALVCWVGGPQFR